MSIKCTICVLFTCWTKDWKANWLWGCYAIGHTTQARLRTRALENDRRVFGLLGCSALASFQLHQSACQQSEEPVESVESVESEESEESQKRVRKESEESQKSWKSKQSQQSQQSRKSAVVTAFHFQKSAVS